MPYGYGLGLLSANNLSDVASAQTSLNNLLATTQARFADGTAAAPSISFTSDTDTGFYRSGANQVAFASNGVDSLTFNASGVIGGVSGGSGITLQANGTNQSITLTPSGTGYVYMRSGSGLNTPQLYIAGSIAGITQAAVFSFSDVADNSLVIGTTYAGGSTNRIDIRPALVQNARFLQNGHLLLGGLTTDGTGVLQFPAATTSAGGITLGTDVQLFRSASGILSVLGRIQGAGLGGSYIDLAATSNYASGTAINLSPNGATALTLDSSQNSIFYGDIRFNTGSSFDVGATATRARQMFTNALFVTNASTLGYTVLGTDTLSGAGAVSVTKDTTKLTSTGVAQAITLADGVDGQIKRIIHDVDGGSMVLTPSTKTGYTTITFTNAGDAVTLEFVTTRGWIVTGIFGAVAA